MQCSTDTAEGRLKLVRAQRELRRQPEAEQGGHCDQAASARNGIHQTGDQADTEPDWVDPYLEIKHALLSI